LGAFKLANGEEVWRFYGVPNPAEPGSESWSDSKVLPHGGGSYWTPLSLDRNMGIVYARIGNPAPDFYGDVRKGANLHTNSAVALDVKTGKVLWLQQFVPHDVHDWDLTQVSPLISTNVKGKPVNVVIVSGNEALQRAVDRDTHKLFEGADFHSYEHGCGINYGRRPRLSWVVGRRGVEQPSLQSAP
jgi:glucose dehydrogenase